MKNKNLLVAISIFATVSILWVGCKKDEVRNLIDYVRKECEFLKEKCLKYQLLSEKNDL